MRYPWIIPICCLLLLSGCSGHSAKGDRSTSLAAKAQKTGAVELDQDNDGKLDDVYIPSTITRDTELAAGLATKQNALGYTPENSASKGQPNGYASLGSDGIVPSTQLPSSSGISHATSDGNYYASRNGAWSSLAGAFAAALGGDDNYVTDAEKVKLSNLSGTNTGDQDLSGYATKTALVASINAGVPNGTGATVHWSQLTGVPSGFADNSDDGAGGGDMVYPEAGVPLSTGSDWGASYTVGSSANNLIQLNSSGQLPAVSAALLTNFPTLNQDTTGSAAKLTTARTIGGVSFDGSANINLPGVNTTGNQNTTGTAAGLTAQYIDWNASSGGSSIANKPSISGLATSGITGNLTLSKTGTTPRTATFPDAAGTVAYTSSNITGTAAGLTSQYVDWSASTGGASIANKPTLGTSAQYNVGTAVGNIVQLGDDGSGNSVLPFTLDLMDLTSGGTAISPPGTSGYALTANTLGVITWAAMSGGLASTDIDTSAELRALLTDEVGTGAAYFVGGALGTPASVTLTNGTGLPVSGITNSTSAPLGLGSVELGHASDTTITRSAAGIITVEGVTVTRTIASGTSALGTAAIASGACATVVTTTATGTDTTDVIEWGFNTRISQVTGYGSATTGALRIDAYPTANNVNFEVCNTTDSNITPGAVTLNWVVRR